MAVQAVVVLVITTQRLHTQQVQHLQAVKVMLAALVIIRQVHTAQVAAVVQERLAVTEAQVRVAAAVMV
jgi:hypothetical protein